MEYAVAFAIVMFLWAILPGPGLAAVFSRALDSGPKLAVVAGLVIADFIYLRIAVGTSYFVYGGYIILADRTRRLVAWTKAVKRHKRVTGAILIGSGIVVATR